MQEPKIGRVCELFYREEPAITLPKLVHKIGLVLGRMKGVEYKLTWDSDDIATFDMPGCRILLAVASHTVPEFALQILVSVGPSPTPLVPGVRRANSAALCQRIANRIIARLPADERRDRSYLGVLTPDLADDVLFTDARKMAHKVEWKARRRAENRAESRHEAPQVARVNRAFRRPPSEGTDSWGAMTERLVGMVRARAAATAAYFSHIGHVFGHFMSARGSAQLPR